jgi:uncharacterized protein
VRIAVDIDVAARMRDGTTLRANVYRPDGDGPWPTLLTRLPYSKDDQGVLTVLDPVQAARKGFMVVIQDCRGRFASEGEWIPFWFEGQDGHDTVEWAAGLPGSNGRVGMYGESYFGNTQWLAAFEQPSSLGAISPAFTWSEPMDGLFARGRAVELGLGLTWSIQTGMNFLQRSRRDITPLIDAYDRLVEDDYDPAILDRRGLPGTGLFRGVDEPEFAARTRVAGRHSRVTVPTFHTAGWHDLFLQGTLDNYGAMSALGREARLLVGPWTHATFADPIGDEVFGVRAARFGAPSHRLGDANDLQLAWFRHHLAGDRTVELPQAPVRIFVMGRNVWRDESSWPLAREKRESWFLHPDGSLSPSVPSSDAAESQFHYDPSNPVPTRGGSHLMSPEFPAGPLEQSRVEERADVLVFTSAPLDRDLEVSGRIKAVLHAESSAPATDWVVRLCDVHPDGRSFNLCDGILRAGNAAGERHRYEIDLWSTSNVFLAGHRLRVQVTSSCFPRWDRPKHRQIARQRVHHDASRPSYIDVPVIG